MPSRTRTTVEGVHFYLTRGALPVLVNGLHLHLKPWFDLEITGEYQSVKLRLRANVRNHLGHHLEVRLKVKQAAGQKLIREHRPRLVIRSLGPTQLDPVPFTAFGGFLSAVGNLMM